MAYSDFDLEKALSSFSLKLVSNVDLFADVTPIEPSEELKQWLEQFSPLVRGLGTELARSVYVVGPILAEVMRRAASRVLAFAGVSLDVDAESGLVGNCDFLITHARQLYYLRGPLCMVVKVTKRDIRDSLGACVAELVAAQRFNELDKTPLPTVCGCVTAGNIWRFLKLEGNSLFIHKDEHYINNLPAILGILVHIATTAPPV